MLLAIAAYCAGITVPALLPSPAYVLLVSRLCLLPVCFALWRLVSGNRNGRDRRFNIIILSFFFGVLWHCVWALSVLEQGLDDSQIGEEFLLTGHISSMVQQGTLAQQFTFRVDKIDFIDPVDSNNSVDKVDSNDPVDKVDSNNSVDEIDSNDSVDEIDSNNSVDKIDSSVQKLQLRKVALNYYGEEQLVPGQRWRLRVTLKPLRGRANSGGFDYEAWSFQQGIRIRGSVRPGSEELLPGYSQNLNAWRYRLRESVLSQLSDANNAALLLALTLGEKSLISEQQRRLFSVAGVSHLFVISGLHIGLVAVFVLGLVRKTAGLFPFILLKLPAQHVGAIAALIAAFLYSLLAGFTLPTQRAFVMIMVFLCFVLLGRKTAVSFRFLLALALVLTLNPLATLNAGFWFSFTAVAALLLFCFQSQAAAGESETLSALVWRQAIQPQWLVFIALTVPLLLWSIPVTLLSPLINVLAIPVVGFCVVPLCLLALVLGLLSPGLAQPLLIVADGLLSFLLRFLEVMVAATPEAFLLPSIPLSGSMLLVLIVAALLLLLPRGFANKLLILPLLIPLKYSASVQVQHELAVHFLDVGQGLAVVVQTPHHALMFDVGGGQEGGFDMGSAVVVPALRELNITQLDSVIISHGDNDHAGGLSGLLETYAPAAIISGSELAENKRYQACHFPQRWQWDGVEFKFLNVSAPLASSNNRSCILKVSAGNFSVLLAGDIDKTTEQALVNRLNSSLESQEEGQGKSQLKSSLLGVPHHGSKSSSSYALLKNVRPEYAVVSAGYLNRFGHPHEEVRDRYRQFGAATYNTANSGMLSFYYRAESSQIKVEHYRREHPRYWRYRD